MTTTSPKLSFAHFGKRLPIIRQNEASECGNACLAMVCSFYGYKTDLNSLRRRLPTSSRGIDLRTLMKMGSEVGFSCRAIKVDLEDLSAIRLPAILHWDLNHFVVLKQVSASHAIIHDPAKGEVKHTFKELSNHFTGIALELEPTSAFEKKDVRTKLQFSQLWSSVRGLGSSLVQILTISLILEIIALANPFYMQVIIDTVLPTFDTDLLLVLAIGFGLLVVVNLIAQALRDYIVLYIGTHIGYQVEVNLFNHVLHLPLEYFEKRHVGDLISRFSSIEPIKSFLTNGLITAILDGAMSVLTLTLLFIYSPTLASIVLISLAMYGLLRLIMFKNLQNRTQESIIADALEQSNFIETVRGILSIKVFAHEAERQQRWQNLLTDAINRQVKVSQLDILFSGLSLLITGIENVIIVYVAANMVINAEFSIGMLFAFMAFRGQFVGASIALVDRIIEYKMLDIHLERLADIAYQKREEIASHHSGTLIPHGQIEVKNLSFLYDRDGVQILDNVNFKIAPGETIAIIGSSGAGKSTLLKLMLGLFKPSSGTICIDDMNLEEIGLSNYRRQIASVMQDDNLFAGTLAENISMFSSEIDYDWVETCARHAQIHSNIVEMPLRYETGIGDMGSALSGGQKQRVMLARALYQKPKILFMDEGTSQLDVKTEALVNSSIMQLGITRVLIAHRPETIKMADRIFRLEGGRINPLQKWNS